MTARQAQLIQAARSYMGARWRHQGRSKDRGIDCGGLPWCASRDCGWLHADMKAYGRYPDGKSLRAHLRQELVEISFRELQPADVVLLLDVIPGVWPCHVAIVADCKERLTLIHSSAQEMRVVENGIDPSWEAKIVGCFRFKQIAEEVGPWRS